MTLLPKEGIDFLIKSVMLTKYLPYDMAEFGVFNGGSAKIISQVNSDKTLHLFDTFSGMPFDDEVKSHNYFKTGDFKTDLNKVKNYLADCKVEYHVGVFQNIALPDIKYSFVHIDSDLYQNIIAGIDYFYPRLVEGGVIVFDDFGNVNCAGVEKAIREKGLIDKIVINPHWRQCRLINEYLS